MISISLDQVEYISTLQEIVVDPKRKMLKEAPLLEKEKESLRTLIGQIGWVSGQTRPDLAYDLCDLSRHVKNATVKDLFHANKVVAKAKMDNVQLHFPSFESAKNLKIVTFNDASFGNLEDGGSQGGFVSFTVDVNNKCCPVMWQSHKLRRIAKSTMAAETLMQVEAAEASFWLGNLLSEILFGNSKTRSMPKIDCLTDSNQLYEAAHSLKAIKDKRLRIDMALIQEMLNRKELSRLLWIEKSKQLADSLTKRGASSRTLLEVLSRGTLMFVLYGQNTKVVDC